MKNTTLIVFCVLGMQSLYAQNEPQKTVQQLENGVIIVQSNGVPSQTQNEFKPNPVRTINDLNLAECEDALRHIQEKIDNLNPKENNLADILSYYKEEQEKIMQRKSTLIKQQSK